MGEEDQEMSNSMRNFIDDSSVVDYQPLNRMEVIQMTDSKLKTKVYNADSDEGGLSESESRNFDETEDQQEDEQQDVTDQEEEQPIDQDEGFQAVDQNQNLITNETRQLLQQLDTGEAEIKFDSIKTFLDFQPKKFTPQELEKIRY